MTVANTMYELCFSNVNSLFPLSLHQYSVILRFSAFNFVFKTHVLNPCVTLLRALKKELIDRNPFAGYPLQNQGSDMN